MNLKYLKLMLLDTKVVEPVLVLNYSLFCPPESKDLMPIRKLLG
jgi:hypothetical protein